MKVYNIVLNKDTIKWLLLYQALCQVLGVWRWIRQPSYFWCLQSRGGIQSICDRAHGTLKLRVGAQSTLNRNFYNTLQFTKHFHEHYPIWNNGDHEVLKNKQRIHLLRCLLERRVFIHLKIWFFIKVSIFSFTSVQSLPLFHHLTQWGYKTIPFTSEKCCFQACKVNFWKLNTEKNQHSIS